MKALKIQGGRKLKGTVRVSGAKNSSVALIPAAILSDDVVTICNVPEITDIDALSDILEYLGADVKRASESIVIDPKPSVNRPIPTSMAQKLRASYYFMGALLGKYKHVEMSFPGGCSIGARPINLHLKGFEALGAKITQTDNVYIVHADKLKGANIYLDIASVGATINIMLAAVRAEGVTTIDNAAKEPEIVNVATFLNNMGAKIRGAGTDVIRIEGVSRLSGCRHTVIPDRIEAGTYLAAAAAMGERVHVKNVIVEHIEGLVAKMEEMGVKMEIGEDSILVHKSDYLTMTHVKTLPYPGFATDLQQPLTPLMLKAHGDGTIIDTIYPKRINHIPELVRMGARAKVESDTIILTGPNQLTGVEVTATDLRAGACLVIAGLMAKGTTTISGVENILRGYDNIIDKLTALGADIQMIED